MIFRFGADVERPDGGKLGQLTRVILDERTLEVTSFTLQRSGLYGHESVAPIGAVEAADDQVVRVALVDEQLDALPIYEIEHNVAPPPDAAEVTSDLLPEVPDVLPVGFTTGVESIAYTPVIEDTVHVPVDSLVLDKGSAAWAIDGEIGHVTEVRANDQTRLLESLIVKHGLVFTHDTEIPIASIEAIRNGAVILSVAKGDLGGDDE
ncbi:MAG: hypothetical protein ACRDFX_03130 [Chloroflexota bacterium]